MKNISYSKYPLKYKYLLTEDGKIYSQASQKFLSTHLDKDGYEKVRLVCDDDKRHTFSVHRLMMENFSPREDMINLQVNHKDGNKLNNHISNLEWCTCEENIHHAIKNNLRAEQFGEHNPASKLTEKEVENLRFQFGTSSLNKEKYGGRRYLPYVYTEQVISMLAGVLKNEIAIQVSINIIRAFIEMRKFITNNAQVFERLTKIEYKMLEHDKKFDIVFNELQKEKKTEFKEKIFFEGQIYDAYSLIIDIIQKAKHKILIIDNYIDASILKMLSKKNKNVEVIILTLQNTNLNKLDINKFNKQYPTLKVAYTNKFHDRFIVIDNEKLYHIGASLKDLGKKCFAISKIEDDEYIEKISHYI